MPHSMNNKQAIAVFVAFALAYFFSALIRAITATLSPVLTLELSLQARDLGLLAGGYFLGFAVMQLPLGRWLDRIGPKKVNVWLLALAVVGCVIFSLAQSFAGLLAARVLIGVGVSACLMAALTGFRHWFTPERQLRANSWMLMSGSMGMLASTLPVQWLMPVIGWRALFALLAVMFVIAMVVLVWQVPQHQSKTKENASPEGDGDAPLSAGYGEVFKHPYFRRMAWVGMVNYGGMLSIQTLWSVPWMMKVGGYTDTQASAGLFAINLAMLCTFWTWGWVAPKLAQSGWSVNRLITWGTPLNLLLLALLIL
ncbi:MAG: MFS transporter, partial [Betaproteobacteria bacterium]|nr:MFS transporter [Betaproteobacteria bacterium]